MGRLNGGTRIGNNVAIHEGMRVINFNQLSRLNMTGELCINGHGKRTKITHQNGSYIHFITNADRGFYFEPNLYVKGNIYAGNSYNELVLTTGNISSQRGVSADMVDGYHVDDTKTGADTSQNNALWTANKVKNQLTALKNEILGGAGSAYDTLKEIQDAILNDQTGFAALSEKINSKLDKTGKAADSDKLDGLHSNSFKRRSQWASTTRLTAGTLYRIMDYTRNTAQSSFDFVLKLDRGVVNFTINIASMTYNIVPISSSVDISGGIELVIVNSGQLYTLCVRSSYTSHYTIEMENPFALPVNVYPTSENAVYTIPAGATLKTLNVTHETNCAILDQNNKFSATQHFGSDNTTYNDPAPGMNASIKTSDNIISGKKIISRDAIQANSIQLGRDVATEEYNFEMRYNTVTKRVEFNFL